MRAAKREQGTGRNKQARKYLRDNENEESRRGECAGRGGFERAKGRSEKINAMRVEKR